MASWLDPSRESSRHRVLSFKVHGVVGWFLGVAFGFALGLGGGIVASGCWMRSDPVPKPALGTAPGARELGVLYESWQAPRVFAFDPRPDTQCFALVLDQNVALWCGEREQ